MQNIHCSYDRQMADVRRMPIRDKVYQDQTYKKQSAYYSCLLQQF